MDHRRHQQREEAPEAADGRFAAVRAALGQTVVGAHEHAEAGVAGHGRDRARESRADAVHHHVADVFPQREAQRDEHRVHHRVEAAVELRRAPGAPAQEKVLEALLRERHDDEVHPDRVGGVVLAARQEPGQRDRAEALRRHGQEGRDDAEEHQREQQLARLLLDAVVPVDVDEQDDRRQDGRADQQRLRREIEKGKDQ